MSGRSKPSSANSKEELGISVEEACLAPLTFASFAYPGFHLLMPLYRKPARKRGCGANFRNRRSEALGNIMRLMRRELHSRVLARFCH